MIDDPSTVLGGGLRVLQREPRVVGDVLRVSHCALEGIAEPRELLPNFFWREVLVLFEAVGGGQEVEHGEACPHLEQAFATEHRIDERQWMDEMRGDGT